MTMKSFGLINVISSILLLGKVQSFTLNSPTVRSRQQLSHVPTSATTTRLQANNKASFDAQRRKELMTRKGPFFKLDRMQGNVEFGSTAKLVTKLDETSNPDGIKEWLSDGRGLALSIWDEDLMKDLGNNVYRLQIMKLQFVTIQLAPRVDVKMWTQKDPNSNNDPVFLLQSMNFDPNIEVLPGVGVPASALGIEIDVAGQLRSTKDGTGVRGTVSFATKGILPPPMRLLPDSVLKGASDTINESIVKLAVQSFQKGATLKYNQYKTQKESEREAAAVISA